MFGLAPAVMPGVISGRAFSRGNPPLAKPDDGRHDALERIRNLVIAFADRGIRPGPRSGKFQAFGWNAVSICATDPLTRMLRVSSDTSSIRQAKLAQHRRYFVRIAFRGAVIPALKSAAESAGPPSSARRAISGREACIVTSTFDSMARPLSWSPPWSADAGYPGPRRGRSWQLPWPMFCRCLCVLLYLCRLCPGFCLRRHSKPLLDSSLSCILSLIVSSRSILGQRAQSLADHCLRA